jgi:alpha-tubulin suppressor-like RCC1 family protein
MNRITRLVACFGNGQFGRLGNGTQSSELFPRVIPQLQGAVAVSAGGAHTAAVTGPNNQVLEQLGCKYPCSAGKVEVPAWQCQLLTTLSTTAAEDGGLWTFGINNNGQLVRVCGCACMWCAEHAAIVPAGA